MAKEPVKKKKPAAKKAVAQSKKAKAPSGTLTERMGEVRNRPNKGLPARIERPRGNLNRANPPKEIRAKGQGGTSRSLTRGQPPARFKPVPLGDRPKMLSGPKVKGGGGIKVTSLLGGPVGMAAGILATSATPAGEGSDNPSGKLFSPSQNRAAGRGNPKTTNRYTPSRKKDIVGRNPNEGLGTSRMPKASMAGGGVNRPESKPKVKAKEKPKAFVSPPRPKARPSVEAAPKAKAPNFKGNWSGAAPTEMQKRGGQRIKRPNLLDLLRSKKR